MFHNKKEIKYFNVGDLQDYENNARYHTDDQIAGVEASMAEFGFINPILIDENNIIIAGHCRKVAAIGIGMDEVPCIVLEGLTENQKNALRIADNRLPQNAQWDPDMLIAEVGRLHNDGYNTDILGFDQADIDKMLDSIQVPEPEPIEDPEPAAQEEPQPAAKPGPDLGDDKKVPGLEEVTIKIKIPKKFEEQVKEFLAIGEVQTPGGMGRGILKRLDLI